MAKTGSLDYMAALDAIDGGADAADHGGIDIDCVDDDAESEAERLAEGAAPPRRRADGHVMGSAASRLKPMPAAQLRFAEGVIAGQSLRSAYRQAYPNDKTSDGAVSANAWRLSKRPKVAAMLEAAWGQTAEVLAVDLAATRLWVMRQLVAVAKDANQEGSKLKALELLGKASGAFTQAATIAPETVTADQLKRELSGHLRLLDNVKAIKTG